MQMWLLANTLKCISREPATIIISAFLHILASVFRENLCHKVLTEVGFR